MRRSILYILGIAALFSSCTKEKNFVSPYLNGDEKTPLVVVSNVHANPTATKAVDGAWNEGDEFLAYIKHVTTTGSDPLVWAADVTGSGVGPRLANFQISGITQNHDNIADNFLDHTTTSTLAVTDAEGLYWDDFNNSASSATDIRTSGHALMSYYGYCYNGSPAYGQPDTHIKSDLVQATGVLGWSVATDQTAGFKTSDLLFSGQQTPVAYDHGTASGISGRDRILSIPYTHAMSKVTVVLELGEGFNSENTNFASTTVTLQGMNTVATVTAPTESLSAFGTSGNIGAVGIADGVSPNMKKSFSALIAPTVMKNGKLLAKIVNIDGNDYDLVLTHAALTTATSPKVAWNQKLSAYNATSVSVPGVGFVSGYTEANGGITLPGVHYIFTATIKKQEIKVEATINDWDTVNAEGYGTIQFANDIIDKTGDISADLKTNGFDIYKSATTTFGTKETTVSWDAVNSKWVYTPTVYWANSSDKSYFRALSGAIADDPATDSENESLAMSQGQDVLWGTTAAHSGTDVNGNLYSYDKSDKIDPRTGNVPLEFEHAMTKVSFILKNADGIEDAAKVDLDGAQISIINLYNGGTIDVNTGDISDLTLTLTPPQIYTLDQPVDGGHKLLNQVVIPQSLVEDKEGASRDTTPSYYQSNELTAIYPNTNPSYESLMSPETSANTSIGLGEATYYLTSELVVVPEVLFTDSDLATINTHNAGLPGAVSTTIVKEAARLYTLEEFNTGHYHQSFTEEQFNTIPEAGKIKEVSRSYTLEEFRALVLTEEQFNALPDELKVKTSAPLVYYTFEEYKEHNPLLNAAITPEQYADYTGDKTRPAVLYTYSEYTALESLTAEMFTALPAELKTKAAVYYTEPEANAYNATLPGAWHVGDVKVPAHYKLPSPAPASHNAGDLKQAGNKIMLYVTLADGTRYGIELAKCEETSSHTAITEWQRGKHYTYTISLQKEQITFRALIKDWVETSGGGNANLEWD